MSNNMAATLAAAVSAASKSPKMTAREKTMAELRRTKDALVAMKELVGLGIDGAQDRVTELEEVLKVLVEKFPAA